MKICIIGTPSVPLGRHNLRDPRLDQADRLVEAKKKTYAQIDLVGPEDAGTAEAILVSADHFADLILKDLEFIETRLERHPQPAEQLALEQLKTHLEHEGTVFTAALEPAQRQALAIHSFVTNRPIIVGVNGELTQPAPLVLRAFQEAGFICFLTVGGKENRAWPVRRGATAWASAGAIHSDIQKGFIRAEVIGFDDFLEAGGETQAKRAGKLRLETKQYLIQDYDVVNFRFNK
jgi:hypothetical protein